MGNTSLLMWGVFFGAIGFGYFSYGKKQGLFAPLVVGIALFIVPYFISNTYLLVAVGFGLVTLPYFIKG